MSLVAKSQEMYAFPLFPAKINLPDRELSSVAELAAYLKSKNVNSLLTSAILQSSTQHRLREPEIHHLQEKGVDEACIQFLKQGHRITYVKYSDPKPALKWTPLTFVNYSLASFFDIFNSGRIADQQPYFHGVVVEARKARTIAHHPFKCAVVKMTQGPDGSMRLQGYPIDSSGRMCNLMVTTEVMGHLKIIAHNLRDFTEDWNAQLHDRLHPLLSLFMPTTLTRIVSDYCCREYLFDKEPKK